MPLYDYSCERCGPFREWREMRLYSRPIACPSCGGKSPRAITAPNISSMSKNSRIAHHRNEKSADQPEVVTKKQHDHGAHGKSRGHGHGHAHPSHSHGPSRPWMIGH